MHLACGVGPIYGCNPEFLSKKTKSEKIYPFFVKEKKNEMGRGDKYLEERNIFLEERGKILFTEEKEKILFLEEKHTFFQRRRKTYFSSEEKEKILFFRGEGKNTFFWRRRKRIEKFGKGKNIFCGGEEKRRRKRRKNICRRKIR